MGSSPAMQALRAELRAVAPTQSTVLLWGETGVGKGVVAREIHRQSRRARGPWVHLDCGALSPTLVESELFGHERGAFTSADERRLGRFERADGGTLFLDEIGDLSLPLQGKLLRVLQDRTFERVGGTTTLEARARIVAATNRDLRSEIRDGRFRPDLYYRLQVCEIRVCPLRERLEDLPLLVRSAVQEIARRLEVPTPRIPPQLVARLREHAWPGNVRELRNVLERLLISSRDGALDPALLERLLRGSAHDAPHAAPLPAAPESRAAFEARERARLLRALARHRWNVSATARALGLSRGALRGRIRRLGLRT